MGKVIQAFTLVLSLVSVVTALAPVILGTAGEYAILAKSGITTIGSTNIVGNLGISPAAAASVTGFQLESSADGTSSSSSLVTGVIRAADYTSPTPSTLTTAISDMEAAYTDAAGRSNPNTLNYLGGQISNMIIPPGLHKWTTAVTMGGTNTIKGTSSDIFIFQISGTLNFGAGAKILLAGGAKASNVFYQAAGAVTLGSSSAVQGIILGKTGISFNSGASLDTGRALAQTAVTLIGNTIKSPEPNAMPKPSAEPPVNCKQIMYLWMAKYFAFCSQF